MRKITPELLKAVNETIREDLRDEAVELLFLGSNDDRNDFLEAYEKDQGNICCLILDYAKRELIKKGILEQRELDSFGRFPFENDEEEMIDD